MIIAAPGLMPLRVELTLSTGGAAPLDALLDAEVHYTEVVSVSPEARDIFASYQPTSVLAGADLNRELEATLGATLQAQPGVAERSLGPGPSRPVIRGMDGDRVLILENGQRVGDLSSQSGDHGVPVNPASATRIEVVRGPATLLYGANAIGGLVNVIDETIPTRPVDGAHGTVMFDAGSAAREANAATALSVGNGRWAAHVGGSGKRNGDVHTPEGEVENSQSRGGFGNAGVSFTGQKGYVGASYGYDNTRYGIPFVEEGQVELTPRRHVFAAKAEASKLGGFVEGIRADFAARRYQHDEIVGGEIGTHFENDTNELNLFAAPARRRPLDRHDRRLADEPGLRRRRRGGAVAERRRTRRRGLLLRGADLAARHVPVRRPRQSRVVRARGGLPARSFTDASGSVGLLIRPEAAGDKLTIALSLARASRNPALEELYFFGPHPGNFAFEIGNPDLGSEHALGMDASLRWRTSRSSGEVTLFRNDIGDYIFRNPISAEEFDRALRADRRRANSPTSSSWVQTACSRASRRIPISGCRVPSTSSWEWTTCAETLKDSGEPLPRIPPLRGRIGLNISATRCSSAGKSSRCRSRTASSARKPRPPATGC